MLLPDVNLLVYVHRPDERTSRAYAGWFSALVEGPEPFALSTLVATAFVRLVTNARMYRTPTPPDMALAVIDSLLRRPNCRPVWPGPRHWEIFSALCRAADVRGARASDAAHAAVAIENGCELVSRDGDFSRFVGAGLRFRLLRPEA